MYVKGKRYSPCCKKFEDAFHKLAIIKNHQDKWLIALSVSHFGNYDVLEEEFVGVAYCPFCGKKIR